ncbi:MAG: DUF3006 domain-containing protein [Clostridia bacterium]|nr:DUF3006 domain-containing protein [Clostridia bacterium]
MIYSVDRIEGDTVVLITDDGAVRREARAVFSTDVYEGAVFFFDGGSLIPCSSLEDARRKRVRAWMNRRKAEDQ